MFVGHMGGTIINLTCHMQAMWEFDSKKGKFTGQRKYITDEQSNWYLDQALKLQADMSDTKIGKTD